MLSYFAGFTEENTPFTFSLLDLLVLALVYGIPVVLAVMILRHPTTGPKKFLLFMGLGFGVIVVLCATAFIM